MKPEPILYGDRRVYTVSAFNDGVASWLSRLPTLWVEGDVTELNRREGRPVVFFTLRDPDGHSSVPVTIPRTTFDALRSPIADGDRVHVFGRPELWTARARFGLRALTIEPLGLGTALARLEHLRQALAKEGLFAEERKRALPLIPQKIGLVTGRKAAAKQDVIAAIRHRFPPARIVVAETYVQGPRAPLAIADALRAVCRAGVDVVILARGGGSFDDLLPFSDERVVRAVAGCPVPVVSAVGHEQDTPLCDLAADVRASTPTAAARLVVPDRTELAQSLSRLRERLARAQRAHLEAARTSVEDARGRLARAPSVMLERKAGLLAESVRRLREGCDLMVERHASQIEALGGRLRALAPSATLARGYAIARLRGHVISDVASVRAGDRVDVELARGSFGARVEDVTT